jgi:hypothetical protein
MEITTEMLERARAKEAMLKPKVDKMIAQYQRGLLTVEDLARGIVEANNDFEDVNAAHDDRRHDHGTLSDSLYWATLGCLGCADLVPGPLLAERLR